LLARGRAPFNLQPKLYATERQRAATLSAMRESEFRLPAEDGTPLFVRAFLPEREPKAVLQVVHGMAEHSARYARLARQLTQAGYALYAADHRGHGKTAARREELGHFADENGWELVVGDAFSVLAEIKSRHPGLPLFMLGQSMGSYIARAVAIRSGAELAGLALSATSHDSPALLLLERAVVAFERARLGRRAKSALLRKTTFETFNKQIDDPRTNADWLSRDRAEVDKYVVDPLCGYECTTQLWHDVMTGIREITAPQNLAKMPRELPVYVIAGDADPLNHRLADIRRLERAFQQAGVANLTVRIYPGGRHEMFNETNRDEVTRELITWLDKALLARPDARAPASSSAHG
jgi:alpha-beta hydrolase superfamily lysophospholipase